MFDFQFSMCLCFRVGEAYPPCPCLSDVHRQLVGEVVFTYIQTNLVEKSNELAAHHRVTIRVTRHSGQNLQFTLVGFGHGWKTTGTGRSQGGVGDCYYNAIHSFHAES